MKIDINTVDRENFIVSPQIIGGEQVFLVNPTFSTKWNKENLHFRSSVWDKDGNPVSLGFKKFFNAFIEHPEITPPPTALKGARLTTKMDGSLLIISKWKGNLIVRTRGTVDARRMENGHEIDLLLAKYPNILADNAETWDYSLLFEWVSPANVIILTYPEPDIYLIGKVFHSNYQLETQDNLDTLAQKLNVKRPEYFTFDTIPDMVKSIEALQDKEGIVIYFGENQNQLLKLKSISYLAKHRFKSQASLDNTVDLYFSYGCPDHQTFTDSLVKQFDFECMQMVEPFCGKIVSAKKRVDELTTNMHNFVQPLKTISRKEAAAQIIGTFGNQAGYCFTLLDNKPLAEKDLKKLVFAELENSQKTGNMNHEILHLSTE